ncbi:hypothetical protein FSARC_10866 [Fusarium sarcochroum]|uniref:Uncharacterized protein n=1 Tax=Fusarium sarcochroum TaxID=1208366 RepID=A0A8H4X213_9HYPO|nr:hypothetical protein FSARC_10866 [Fusarium sarcochroum]
MTLQALYGGGGSKSASPRKRSTPAPREAAHEDNGCAWYQDHLAEVRESEVPELDHWHERHFAQVEEEEEGNSRGRKRARLSDQSFANGMATPPLCYSSSNSSASTDSLGSPGIKHIPKSDVPVVSVEYNEADKNTS